MQTHHEDRGTSPRTTDYPPPAVPRHLAVPLPVSFRQGRRDPKELISLRIADKCGLCVYLGGLTRLRKRPERRLAQATSGGAPRPQAEPLATTADEAELATTRITATGSAYGKNVLSLKLPPRAAARAGLLSIVGTRSWRRGGPHFSATLISGGARTWSRRRS